MLRDEFLVQRISVSDSDTTRYDAGRCDVDGAVRTRSNRRTKQYRRSE